MVNHLDSYIKEIKTRRPRIPPEIMSRIGRQSSKESMQQIIKDYLYEIYRSKWTNVDPNSN